MIFKSNGGDYEVWIGVAPFNPDEAVAGARLAHKFQGKDPRGFNVQFKMDNQLFYNTSTDLRLKDDTYWPTLKTIEEREAWIIEELEKKSSGYGKYYHEYVSALEKVEITQGELSELRKRADGGNGATKDTDELQEEVERLKRELKIARTREANAKKKAAVLVK